MNKLVLAATLLVAGTAVSKEVDVKGTMLPMAVKSTYDMCQEKGVLDQLPEGFKEVAISLKEGNTTFNSETLDKSVPNWQLMYTMAA